MKFQTKTIENGYMQTSGSSLQRMIQNQDTPLLDLFVRESIQNSLDAALEGKKSVEVEYNTGSFNIEAFSTFFEDKLQTEIKKKYTKKTESFISVSDKNTIGLTGNPSGKIDPSTKDNNLSKLVFQIMHAQDKLGAGGSWGIGKTVYYRLGVGFTIFYSRIKTQEVYEERIVASFVEDERADATLLKQYQNNIGIAFFGQYSQGSNNPDSFGVVDNLKHIHSFLEIFGISPYTNDDTGTVIIIPFVSYKNLLNHNKPDTTPLGAYWYSTIDDYLVNSIIKWYFPRLNHDYPNGPVLEAKINGKLITKEMYDPFYAILSDLYSSVISFQYRNGVMVESKINIVEITKTQHLKDKCVGWFAYGKYGKEEMLEHNHYSSPYTYIASNGHSDDGQNPPIITFTRRPGMAISYKTSGDWIGKNVYTNDDEYIVGLFVLNSNNTIQYEMQKYGLEEYIRHGEKSDHFDWVDHSITVDGKRIDIVKHITRNIGKELKTKFVEEKPKDESESVNRRLGSIFARLLMPTQFFGKSPNGLGGGGGTTVLSHKKDAFVKLLNSSGGISKDGISLEFLVKCSTKIKQIDLYPMIVTSSGLIKLDTWIEDYGKPPLYIDQTMCEVKKANVDISRSPFKIEDSSKYLEGFLGVYFHQKEKFKISIEFQPQNIDLELRLTVLFRVMDKNYEVTFKSDIEEVKIV